MGEAKRRELIGKPVYDEVKTEEVRSKRSNDQAVRQYNQKLLTRVEVQEEIARARQPLIDTINEIVKFLNPISKDLKVRESMLGNINIYLSTLVEMLNEAGIISKEALDSRVASLKEEAKRAIEEVMAAKKNENMEDNKQDGDGKTD